MLVFRYYTIEAKNPVLQLWAPGTGGANGATGYGSTIPWSVFLWSKEREKRSDAGEEILPGDAVNVIRAGCYSGPGLCPIWDIP